MKNKTNKIKKDRNINIVIPMSGRGTKFKEAGFAFPKPLIDIQGKTMIELVVENIRPTTKHTFIFVCMREQYEQYDLYNILKNASRESMKIVTLFGETEGAACTALAATEYINSDDELLIANADQIIDGGIDKFIASARAQNADGSIITFPSSHPKWSYARVDKNGKISEVAEKKVISNNATAGIYYFKKGSEFVSAAQQMIYKNIRHNNEFFISPVFNELLLNGKHIYAYTIPGHMMHGLGTPEDVHHYTQTQRRKKTSRTKQKRN